MPPRTYAHTPSFPLAVPMTWWSNTYAEPGSLGLHIAPTMASFTRVLFSMSLSKYRSKMWLAGAVCNGNVHR